MTKTTTKKVTIESLSRLVIDNFEKIAAKLDFEYDDYDNRITMCCPVHGGDNASACVMFKDGTNMIGNWSCFTHGCEQQYGISVVGLLKGAIEYKTGKEQTYWDVVKFVERTLSKSASTSVLVENDNYDFCKFADYFAKNVRTSATKIPKNKVESTLAIPSQYYVKRGYSRDILTKYSIGFCKTKGKPFYLRTVVPVFDESGINAVGFLGRTINEKCDKCGWYHYTQYRCPQTKIEKYFASKWINSQGFSKTSYLYNSWFARPYIEKSKEAILVEGPGDIWRLEEAGIHNGLAMFGCKLNKKQVEILDGLGVQRLIVALDNDDAGIEGKEKIAANYGRYFNLEFITTIKNDIGDSSPDEVRRLFNGATDYSYKRKNAEWEVEPSQVPVWI